MKVLVAGATGAIGMPLVRQLLAAGHSVLGITRSEAGVSRLKQAGAEALLADVLDREQLLKAVGGSQADAVISELTALKKMPVRHADMAATNELRITGTENLLDAAREVGAGRFLTQSIVFGYGYVDHGTDVLTEESFFGHSTGGPFDAHVLAMVSTEEQAFHAEGIDGIALRYGLLYGNDADAVAGMLRKRMLPVARHGGKLAFVHYEDAAAATVAALERGTGGKAYNIVDDTPATFRQLVTGIAEATRAPKPLILPGWLLKLGAPYGGAILSDVSMLVDNARAKRELDWTPQYPSYREGLGLVRQ